MNKPYSEIDSYISFVSQVTLLHIDRLVESIAQTIASKENYEEICGDLLALRVIMQNGMQLPAFTLRELKQSIQAIFVRFKDEFSALEGN